MMICAFDAHGSAASANATAIAAAVLRGVATIVPPSLFETELRKITPRLREGNS
jgi:hypothetical protein